MQSLTSREIEVLNLVSQGKINKIIAKELGITDSTVKNHITIMFVKLRVTNRVELVAKAFRCGLIKLELEGAY